MKIIEEMANEWAEKMMLNPDWEEVLIELITTVAEPGAGREKAAYYAGYQEALMWEPCNEAYLDNCWYEYNKNGRWWDEEAWTGLTL